MLARASMICFVGLNLVLVPLRPDLSVREDQISSYLAGPYRPLAVLAFLLLGAGAAVLAIAVRRSARVSGGRVSSLLWVYAAGVALTGGTPPQSVPHAIGALTAFAGLPVADLLSWVRFRLVWFAAMIGSFATWPALHFGLGERLTVAIEVAWLVCLRPSGGRRTSRRQTGSRQTSRSGQGSR